jgi:hypothetical protein
MSADNNRAARPGEAEPAAGKPVSSYLLRPVRSLNEVAQNRQTGEPQSGSALPDTASGQRR